MIKSVFVFLALGSGVAHAQVTASCNAGEAPGGFATYNCNGQCALNGDVWSCNLSACGNGSSSGAWVVTDFNGNGKDFSGFGECNGAGFCCTFADTTPATVKKVRIVGSPGTDDLSLSYSTSDYLRPHRSTSNLLGFIHGGAGNDSIIGSHQDSTDYRDNLYGDDDDDDMEGLEGDDWMFGGNHDDRMFGKEGADAVVGGAGQDELDGGPDDDALCDKAFAAGACSGAQVFVGGDGDDEMYLEYDPMCAAGFDTLNSTGGAGTDVYGHTDWGTLQVALATDTLTAAPAECTDPN